MSQAAKVIDVTRSFLPIDPNSFPETLHGTGREDNPEQRVPVTGYEGQNFLPTSYGYKSYFGTNGKLNIDAIPSRVDHVILFQTETFENLLVALCEEGIYIKNGASSGAWTQLKSIFAPTDPLNHFNWSFVVISDELYCYQAGQNKYQKITSQATAPYYVFTEVTPNFLNMDAQVGIFRAAGVLGFWDTADSVSWCNPDDFADFTPSLETLAGNILFNDVNGRIVTIKPHGPGFIIYASKSIIYIEDSETNSYQWKPAAVLSNSGIVYPEDVAVGIPDTEHYAYTPVGLYKIDKARAEVIVPEVTDFLKRSRGPHYPRIMQGRYLFIQLLDKDYLDSLAGFRDVQIPELPITYPGSNITLEGLDDKVITGNEYCIASSALSNGDTEETQNTKGTGGGNNLPDQKPGTNAQPIWTCYLSQRAGSPDSITWGSDGCSTPNIDGVEQNMVPQGTAHKLANATTDSSNKKAVTGADLFIDGKWTMDRFIQVQTAIWDKEKAELQAYLAKIANRAASQEKLGEETGSCTEENTKSECNLGDYAMDYSDPQFGYSACSFWLTRFITKAGTLKVKKRYHTNCSFVPDQTQAPTINGFYAFGGYPAGTVYPTLNDACIASDPNRVAAGYVDACKGICYNTVSLTNTQPYYASITCPPGFSTAGSPVGACTCFKASHYIRDRYFTAYNTFEDKDIGDAMPETAYCVITGWRYQKNDGSFATVPSNSCTAPTLKGKGGNPAYGGSGGDATPGGPKPPIDNNGEICSGPFTPVTVPGIDPVNVIWPDQTVSLPASSFLLQKGSIGPVYPDFEGALVYDLHLKKWGKMVMRYKQLLDYQPLNTDSGGGIPYDRFGMLAGVVKPGGLIYVFDEQPAIADSWITYGKIGYYRLGMTTVDEVRVDFRAPFDGMLKVETSLDGVNINSILEVNESFSNVRKAELMGGFDGRWHNIVVQGRFDISYMEYRGFIRGRR